MKMKLLSHILVFALLSFAHAEESFVSQRHPKVLALFLLHKKSIDIDLQEWYSIFVPPPPEGVEQINHQGGF